MPATFQSLPSEVLLKVLELLVPPVQTNDLPFDGPPLGPHPLCLTALVDCRFGALSQVIVSA